MGRRWTETDKWADDWFMPLSLEAKAVMLYIWDKCDAAGVWVPNFALAEAQIRPSQKLDWKGVLTEINRPPLNEELDLGGGGQNHPLQVVILPNGKWWSTKFIIFHHGWTLIDEPQAPKGRYHAAVFKALRHHNILEQFCKMFPRVLILGEGQPFKPPTIEDVRLAVAKTNPEAPPTLINMFFHHYNTNGWNVGEGTWQDLWQRYFNRYLQDRKDRAEAEAARRAKNGANVDQLRQRMEEIDARITHLSRQQTRTGPFIATPPEAMKEISQLRAEKKALADQLKRKAP